VEFWKNIRNWVPVFFNTINRAATGHGRKRDHCGTARITRQRFAALRKQALLQKRPTELPLPINCTQATLFLRSAITFDYESEHSIECRKADDEIRRSKFETQRVSCRKHQARKRAKGRLKLRARLGTSRSRNLSRLISSEKLSASARATSGRLKSAMHSWTGKYFMPTRTFAPPPIPSLAIPQAPSTIHIWWESRTAGCRLFSPSSYPVSTNLESSLPLVPGERYRGGIKSFFSIRKTALHSSLCTPCALTAKLSPRRN